MKASDSLQVQRASMSARRVALRGIASLAGCAVAYVALYYLMVGRLIEGNSVSPVYFLLGDSPAAFFRPAHLLDCHIRPGYWHSHALPLPTDASPDLLLLEYREAKSMSADQIAELARTVALDHGVLVVEDDSQHAVHLAGPIVLRMTPEERDALRDRLRAKGYIEAENRGHRDLLK